MRTGRKVGVWIGVGVGVLGAALGAGAWVRGVQGEREREAGLRVARQAAVFARAARVDAAAGRSAEAEAALDRAVGLLRGTRGAGGAARGSLLLDLASLRLSQGPADPAARRAARELLDEAWRVPDLPGELRARAAADLGALSVLEGDLVAAEGWYGEALRRAPGDARAAARLKLLRETPPAGAASVLTPRSPAPPATR